MRFIITSTTDGGAPKTEAAFDPAIFKAYMRFNEELHNAGVLVASEGLLPGTPGARLAVAGGKRKVVDGPFAESKELVGGFYIIDVPTFEDAKAWALRVPVGMASADILEIRQLTGAEDIPAPFLDMAASVAPNWTAALTKKK
ncbi:MAG: dehydrogenase [Myxococcales bacterium]|nr:dehydrogenase [Myxococcales bacterium]